MWIKCWQFWSQTPPFKPQLWWSTTPSTGLLPHFKPDYSLTCWSSSALNTAHRETTCNQASSGFLRLQILQTINQTQFLSKWIYWLNSHFNLQLCLKLCAHRSPIKFCSQPIIYTMHTMSLRVSSCIQISVSTKRKELSQKL